MSDKEKIIKESYRWRGERIIHRERMTGLRSRASRTFRREHATIFRILDTLGIIILVFNFIAISLTTMLVSRTHTGPIVEVNPIQCDKNNFQCATNGWALLAPIFRQMILWIILICAYVLMRNWTYTYVHLYILSFIIILYFVFLGIDAFHDIGVWMAQVVR